MGDKGHASSTNKSSHYGCFALGVYSHHLLNRLKGILEGFKHTSPRRSENVNEREYSQNCVFPIPVVTLCVLREICEFTSTMCFAILPGMNAGIRRMHL